MGLQNSILFFITSLIWGTTWFVIRFQIDSTSAIAGVFYRFLLATIIMILINVLFIRKSMKYSFSFHRFFIIQGLFNFCINYILTYMAEKSVSSGIIAVTFTTLIYFNMIGMKILFKKQITKNLIIGSIIGFIGILLLFWKEIAQSNFDQLTILGIIIGIVATFSASLGNLAAYKNHLNKVPVMTFNTYAMLYGTIFSLLAGLIFQESFYLPTTPVFLGSLFYLAIFGTVLTFWAYQTLVGRLGAEKAAYTSLISPVIAITFSILFEGLSFNLMMFIGMILCFLGNYLALKRNKI